MTTTRIVPPLGVAYAIVMRLGAQSRTSGPCPLNGRSHQPNSRLICSGVGGGLSVLARSAMYCRTVDLSGCVVSVMEPPQVRQQIQAVLSWRCTLRHAVAGSRTNRAPATGRKTARKCKNPAAFRCGIHGAQIYVKCSPSLFLDDKNQPASASYQKKTFVAIFFDSFSVSSFSASGSVTVKSMCGKCHTLATLHRR